MPTRRRQSLRGFLWEVALIVALLILVFVFLGSDLPNDIGRAVASGLRFGPSVSGTVAPSTPAPAP